MPPVQRLSRHSFWITLSLAIGLLATLLAEGVLYRASHLDVLQQRQLQADSVARALPEQLQQAEWLAQLALSRHTLPDGQTASIAGVALASPVQQQDRQHIEAQLRALKPGPGLLEYRLDDSLHPSRPRAVYLPILHGSGVLQALTGLDLLSHPVLKRIPGYSATPRSRLLGPARTGQGNGPGHLFLLHGGMDQRLALVAIQPNALAPEPLRLLLWKQSLQGQQLVWPQNEALLELPPPLASRSFQFAGERWRVDIDAAAPGLPGGGQRYAALGLIGILASVLGALLATQRSRHQQAAADLRLQQQHQQDLLLMEQQAALTQPAVERSQEHELKLQAILDTTQDAIILMNEHGLIELFNPAAERIFGYPASSIMGRDVSELMPESFRERHRRGYEQALRNGELRQPGFAREVMGRRADGSLFPAEVALSVVKLDGAQYFASVIRDVSDRRRAERMLTESEYKHRAILDAAYVGIYLWQDGRLRYVNPTFLRYLGLSTEAPAEQLSLSDWVAAEYLHEVAMLLSTGSETLTAPLEIECLRANGDRFSAILTGQPIIIQNRPGIAGSLVDISKRRQVEEAMRRAREQNEAILQAIPDLMLQLDHHGVVVELRSQSPEAFGLRSDGAGQPLEALLPAQLVDRFRQMQLLVHHDKTAHAFEYELQLSDGQHDFEARMSPCGSDAYLVMSRDITARKTIEAELTQHRDHLAELVAERTAELDTIYQSSPLGIAMVANRQLIYVNPACAKILGRSAAELIGHTTEMLYASVDEYLEVGNRIYPRLAGGDVYNDEQKFLRGDGSPIWCEVHCKAVDASDLNKGTVWVVQDIEERRAAETALRQAKEIAEAANQAKSEFLANMSHELRTPMHAILSFAEMGAGKVGSAPPEKLIHYFSRIDTSGKRLLAILNDLLDLSKLEAGKMQYAMQQQPILPMLEEVSAEFAELCKSQQVNIVLDNQVAAPLAAFDSVRLSQVMRNLLSNALKYSPRQGRIDIVVGQRWSQDRQWLTITVSDQGIGVPPAELDSIFDKFIQGSKTKTGAGGTGLGLAICREIMRAHGGDIIADNAAGGGASFCCYLPYLQQDNHSNNEDAP